MIQSPYATRRSKPTYPRAERRKGIEGTVYLSVSVTAKGRAGSVSVSRSSGNSALDNAALKAVKRWRFKAATDANGTPITKTVTVPVQFRLR